VWCDVSVCACHSKARATASLLATGRHCLHAELHVFLVPGARVTVVSDSGSLAAASAERKLHPQDRDVVAEVQVRNEKRARCWVTTRYVVGSGVKPKYSDHVRLTRDVGSAHDMTSSGEARAK
jgi:predicted proteasome-type protease